MNSVLKKDQMTGRMTACLSAVNLVEMKADQKVSPTAEMMAGYWAEKMVDMKVSMTAC